MHALIVSAALYFVQSFEYSSGGATAHFPYPYASQEYILPGEITTPSLIPFTKGFNSHFSCGRPYYGSEIETSSASVSFPWKHSGFLFRWESFGTDFYRENTYSMSGALSPFQYFSAGAEGSIRSLNISGGGLSRSEAFCDFGLSASSRPLEILTVSLMKTNIRSYLEGGYGPESFDCAGFTLMRGRLISFSWNISRSSSGKINSFSLTSRPLPALIVRAGYSQGTETFTSSVSVILGRMTLDYGLSHHEFLGYSHRMGISFIPGTDTTAPDHAKKTGEGDGDGVIPQMELININTAGHEELLKIPHIDETMARRIAAYREKFGPISQEALARAGLSAWQIREILPCIYGLERDNFLKSRGPKKRYSRKSWLLEKKARVRVMFKKLLSRGVRASRALKYSEISVFDRARLGYFMSQDSELTPAEREAISGLCAKK